MWPAYVNAHKGMLEGGDVEEGKSNGTVKDLVLIESLSQSMSDVLDLVCGKLLKAVGGSE